jgi:four helix bundle protein
VPDLARNSSPNWATCLKELDETSYWLELLVESGCVPAAKMAKLLDETNQLLAIFTTISKKTKAGLYNS